MRVAASRAVRGVCPVGRTGLSSLYLGDLTAWQSG